LFVLFALFFDLWLFVCFSNTNIEMLVCFICLLFLLTRFWFDLTDHPVDHSFISLLSPTTPNNTMIEKIHVHFASPFSPSFSTIFLKIHHKKVKLLKGPYSSKSWSTTCSQPWKMQFSCGASLAFFLWNSLLHNGKTEVVCKNNRSLFQIETPLHWKNIELTDAQIQ